MEDDELVFVLVKEGGAVPFSATYPSEHILESTTAVLEFVKEKYQTTDIKKIYICGEKPDQVVKTLKGAKLLVEELKIDPPEFYKLVSLLQFDDPDLTIRPGSPVPKRSKLPKLPLRKFRTGLGIAGGLALLGLLFFKVIKPQLQPTTEFDKSTYNIQVLNARGVQGAAAKGQTELEELGYTITDTDNTKWSLYSIIKTKEGNEALLDALTADLESDYEFGDPEVLEANSEFDAVLIIGSR